jgi:hypothetical protein
MRYAPRVSSSSFSLWRWALVALLSTGCATRGGAAVAPSSAPSPAVAVSQAQAPLPPDAHLSQEALRADLRQLVRLLEETHPDPYSRAGGRVAFHRRVDELLRSLPPEGMTVDAFFRYVRPLVASLHDGHTSLRAPSAQKSAAASLPLEFEAVEDRLYVSRVRRADLRPLLGATLVGVEGSSFASLSSRMEAARGADNRYHNLVHLADALRSPSNLGDLLGRQELSGPVRFELRRPDGSLVTVPVEPLAVASGEVLAPPSRLSVPEPNAADLAWSFLGPDSSVAYLRIDSMARYREAFEQWRSVGFTLGLGDHLSSVARAAGHPDLPGVDARIAVVPSATELFRELFSAMRREHTATLIVDLRRNTGGSSFLGHILGSFLYPLDSLVTTESGFQVPRYSPLYFESHQGDTLEKVRARSGLALEPGDLDFSEERAWRARQRHGLSPQERERLRQDFLEGAASSPTFARELAGGPLHAPVPPRVVVLTSARTYSAGFDLVALLRAHGATVVGVPPAQAGNCFIDTAPFRLEHSGLSGSISFKYSVLFPEDPANGELLRPDRELRFDELAALGFDPHAAVLLALELSRPVPSPAPAATSHPRRAP